MDTKKINIKIKLGSETEFTIEIDSTATVGELKQAIETKKRLEGRRPEADIQGLAFQ